MKKLLCVILCILLAAPPVFAAVGFDDLPDDHWAVDTIRLARENGIIEGYNENGTWLFKPDNNVSRQECMTMLYRTLSKAGMLTEDAEEASDGQSSGASESSGAAAQPGGSAADGGLSAKWAETMKACGIAEWAWSYCAYGFESGILEEGDFAASGASGFGGGAAASRQLIARWTARAMGYELSPLCQIVYSDYLDIDPENRQYVDALYRKHIMEGSDGLFHGNDGVRRSEMAAVCTRLLGLDPKFAGMADVDPLMNFSGTLSELSAEQGIIRLSFQSVSLYVADGARVALDGTAAKLSDISALSGSKITVSAYVGGENSVVIQSRPVVQHGTVKGVESERGRDVISMELENGIRITLVTDGDSDVPTIRRNRSYDFISDGILILEMR